MDSFGVGATSRPNSNLTTPPPLPPAPLPRSPFSTHQQKYWIVDGSTVTVATGNWAPTDYPGPPNTYPPYAPNPANWRDVNRDFTISYTGPGVVNIFQQVLNGDYGNSTSFYPKTSEPVALDIPLF